MDNDQLETLFVIFEGYYKNYLNRYEMISYKKNKKICNNFNFFLFKA